MTYTLRKAITSEAKPLIGLYSESGCGKTHSSLLLAKGYAGSMADVCMIETESGRGEAWADDPVVGGYSVISMRASFSPKEYGDAIAAAEKSGAKVLIVDSASHEWEGVNGVLGMAAQNQADGKKGPLVWQQPKMQHAREFMLRLTQTPIPLVIVCMRAKYTMEEIKPAHVERWKAAGAQGKPPKVGEWVRSTDLSPKQSEDILYEMFVHGWIDREHAFHGTKYTRDVLRQVFKDGEPITVETGKRLSAWASGAPKSSPSPAPASSVLSAEPGAGGDAGPNDAEIIADVDKFIGLRKFKAAGDCASMIVDDALRDAAVARIQEAYEEATASVKKK